MSDWIDFERWPECTGMERPGVVFEVQNADLEIMTTTCVVPLQPPFDWASPPVRFRVVEEAPPRHSSPLPAPVEK
jgi:hypothetical protein